MENNKEMEQVKYTPDPKSEWLEVWDKEKLKELNLI